ncbi:MAG: UDP-N-acetylglucosamine 1-carboxyvinyltransferase [Candidatus Pacebacteria bacterium]|nr:UDP-N-acetylglucosamine 1-carboxyvinyltransferase [Candidatus Paceibacterota bacterium]
MESFVVHGGKPLKGEIEIKGSKNAAMPVLAAALLTKEPSVIDNIPLIEDVKRFLEIIQSLGGGIEWLGERKVKINPKNLSLQNLDQSLVKKLRASVLLIPPLLHRFGKFKLAQPGGCLIGVRSIDSHLDAISQLGVKVRKTPTYYYYNGADITPQEVTLEEFSVTATENILMLASLIPGKTILKIGALEPHIEDLAVFLRKMGAKIKIISPHIYEITGRAKLSGASHKIIPDPIEAGTFMILATALRSKILIKNARIDHLDLVIKKLKGMGARMNIRQNRNFVSDILMLPSYNLKSVKLQTQPYPGIPTDLQSPFGVLATQANGTSLIFDTMFEGRLKYIDELIKMGANAIIADPHRALITGPTPLYASQNINSLDIRSGMSLLVAALLARGKTIIKDAYQIDRGYEEIDERLKKLGAEIKRVEQ